MSVNKGIFAGTLLASDYDATVTNDKGEIPDRVIESVNYYMSEGGLFSISTGRTKQGYVCKDKLRCNAPCLLANGSMLYDFTSEKVVYTDAVGSENIPFLYKLAKDYPNISIEMYATDFSTFCFNRDECSTKHFENQFIKWTDVTDFEEANFPFVKVMLSVGDRGAEISDYLDKFIPSTLKHIWTLGNFIEIFSSTSGKGVGLLKLADCLGVEHSRVYSAGDGYNDIDMLESAAVSFSPSNSHKNVLSHTDIIVRDNNNSALSHIIEILESWYN